MNILDLNKTESRQLLLLHHRLRYDRPENIANMVKLIKAKGYFKSDAGQIYTKGLINILSGKVPIDCIYCGNPLGDDEHLLCAGCSDLLYDRVNSENKEIQRDRVAYKEAAKDAPQVADDVKNETFEIGTDIYEDVQNAYGESGIGSDGDIELHVETDADNGAYADIGQKSYSTKSKRGFNSENKKSGTAKSSIMVIIIALVILLLMAAMIMLRVGWDGNADSVLRKNAEATDNQNSDETSINEGQAVQRSGNEEIVMPSEGEAPEEDVEYIVPDNAEVSLDDYADDGFMLLGQDYQVADKRFGDYENVVGDNSRYYASCGISLLYDEKTDVIVYIDNDGTGDGSISVPIFDILPGDKERIVRNSIIDNGIAIVDVSGDCFMCRFSPTGNNEIIYELYVSYSDGIVDIVSARFVD